MNDNMESSDKIRNENVIKIKLSRELLDLRKQEKIYFSVKDYDKADLIRKQAAKMETLERSKTENHVLDIIDKSEKALKSKQ